MSLEALEHGCHNLHLGEFERTGAYDIPVLQPVTLNRRFDWIAFNNANACKERYRFGVHFFTDDYLFERLWNYPVRYMNLLKDFPVVTTPDFSLFTDWPLSVQIYNHFRKHLIGAYLQKNGLRVIPTICWSDRRSYNWCFDGEPTGSTIAVSSVGTQRYTESKRLFLKGYDEMLSRLKPSRIVFFGDVPLECEGPIEHHTSFYQEIQRRK